MSNKLTFFSLMMTMFMVVYHFHSYDFSPETGVALFTVFGNHFDYLGSLGMAYFFTASGFLLYNNAVGQLSRKLKSRVRTLLAPYLLWNTIVFLLLTIRGGKWPVDSLSGLILRYTVQPFLGAFWYISWTLVLMLLSPLFVKSAKALLGAAAVTFLFSACYLYPRPIYDWYWFPALERATRYLPCYFLGAYIGLAHPRWIWDESRRPKALPWAAGAVFLAGIAYMTAAPLSVTPMDLSFGGRFLYITSLMVMPAAIWLALPGKWFGFPMGTPYRISFFIYATHNSIVIPILWTMLRPMLEARLNIGWMFASGGALVIWSYVVPAVVYGLNLCVVLALKKLRLGKVVDVLSGGRV